MEMGRKVMKENLF
jgi:hypothetical protein